MAFNTRTEYHRYQRYFTNISRLYQRREVKVYTSLILTFMAIIFFSFFAIRPTVKTIASLIQEIEVQKKIDTQLQTKITNLGQAQKNYSQLTKASLIEEALPTQIGTEQLLYNLEYLVTQEGVNIRSLSFEPIVINGVPKEDKIGFSLAVTGSKEVLDLFLNSLENLRRVVTVDSVSFNKSQKIAEAETASTGNTSDITLNIAGSAYFSYKNQTK